MDFFDDEDEASERPRRRGSVPPPEPAGGAPLGAGGHGGPPNRQQVRARQAMLAIGAILILILLVIAFRGCLNARKDRSFENYVSDLSSITTDTKQLSDSFFGALTGEGASSETGLANEINGDTGASQGLLDRVEGLDAPDEISAAQDQIVLSYDLRHDAIEGIATQVPKLGADQQVSEGAEAAIYTQMRVLSASDILFARGRDQIEQALADEEVVVPDGVPESQFLPDPADDGGENFLDPATVASAFGGAGGTTVSNGDCENDGETHGLGLVEGGSTLQPSGTALTNGGAVTATADDDTIDVAVQNQGTADEAGIEVSVVGGDIDSNGSIDTIAAGATETASIPLQPPPRGGESVTLEVNVAPVGCEQVETNNTASFPITF